MKSSPVRMAARMTLLVLASLLALPAVAAQLVRVSSAHFPPYTVRPEQGVDTGLLPQLVDALNQLQSDYRFELVPTSVARRYRDFEQGRVDIAIFENPLWGWQQIPHATVDMGLEDAEVFVALRKTGRDQDYFVDLKGKSLALFNGYHYAFAGFNPDPQFLMSHYNATLTYSHDSNLLMVLRGRTDVALVTRSYLRDYLAHHAGTAQQLLASERTDQVYHHYALLRPNSPIADTEFTRLMKRLRDSGVLSRIFQPYQVAVLPLD